MEHDSIVTAVFTAIDELNEILPPSKQLQKTVDTALYGANGRLDSLELVNLIVIVEQNVEDALGTAVVLADERAMSQLNSPFRTVRTFVDYICSVLPTALVNSSQ